MRHRLTITSGVFCVILLAVIPASAQGINCATTFQASANCTCGGPVQITSFYNNYNGTSKCQNRGLKIACDPGCGYVYSSTCCDANGDCSGCIVAPIRAELRHIEQKLAVAHQPEIEAEVMVVLDGRFQSVEEAETHSCSSPVHNLSLPVIPLIRGR